MASAKDVVREILRTCGPLPLGEIVDIAITNNYVATRNPKQTVTNALSQDYLIQNTGEKRYVYLPTFIRDARMLVPMDDAVLNDGVLRVPKELTIFLWPYVDNYSIDATATLQLTDTLSVDVTFPGLYQREPGLRGQSSTLLTLPQPFWEWWEGRWVKGADTLVIQCVDGEAKQYRLEAMHYADLDADALASRNALVRSAAEDILRRSRDGILLSDLVRRLLARSVYHQEPPAPLVHILFDPPGQFIFENGYSLSFRPEMTPALRQLFAHRLQDLESERMYLGGSSEGEPDDAELFAVPPPVPPTAVYRFKVTLAWMKRVSRVIEILDNQTLEVFHSIIQTAFGWGNDHLYAFYPSNRAFDSLTSIMPWQEYDNDPPHTDEVTVGALGLKPGQCMLYIFDFGDNLDHEIELMAVLPLPEEGTFPRIVLVRGKAPAQYPSWDEEPEED